MPSSDSPDLVDDLKKICMSSLSHFSQSSRLLLAKLHIDPLLWVVNAMTQTSCGKHLILQLCLDWVTVAQGGV